MPFSVKSGLFNQKNTETLALTMVSGTETFTIFQPTASSDHYSNAAAIIGFKGYLYCQWQSSATNEDSEDTWVAYSRSQDGENWSARMELAPSPSDGYRNTGGWWVNGDTLVAFINHWPSSVNPRGGYAEYRTSIDGITWSSIKRVKMKNGSDLNGIFEQDPHALPNGRIINSAHFQPGLTVSPIYTDDKSGIRGWVRPSFTNMPYSGDVTRELEPSWFYRKDGAVVMIFRDQNSTYVKLASISTNNGQSWTTPVLTNMPDSRSKQSAGNLIDGTAYMISNPSDNKNRIPLAITLSKDGQYFDQAYVLRKGGSDLQAQKYSGLYKTLGYSYPKSTIWNNYLYVAYSVNKEAIQCTRVPLASISLNNTCGTGYMDDCHVCVGGNTGLFPCAETLEAELVCHVDGILNESKNEGFTGEGYVNTDNTIGTSVTFNLNSTSDQTVTVSFRYANGGSTARDGKLYINGNLIQTISFPPTGSWTNWKMSSINVFLLKGNNSLKLEAVSADGLANLDLLTFSAGVTDGGCVITGINAEDHHEDLNIYPNPTQNSVHWKNDQHWILYNAQGKAISNGKGVMTDLSSFPSGLYFLKLKQNMLPILKK